MSIFENEPHHSLGTYPWPNFTNCMDGRGRLDTCCDRTGGHPRGRVLSGLSLTSGGHCFGGPIPPGTAAAGTVVVAAITASASVLRSEIILHGIRSAVHFRGSGLCAIRTKPVLRGEEAGFSHVPEAT